MQCICRKREFHSSAPRQIWPLVVGLGSLGAVIGTRYVLRAYENLQRKKNASRKRSSQVFGVDFGSSTMSIGVAGTPSRVLENQQGLRSIPSVVSIRNGETHIGKFAEKFSHSHPKSCIFATPLLIDSASDRTTWPYDWDANDSIVIDQESYSPEYFMELLLENLLTTAQESVGLCENSVVLTVPPFFTAQQRQMYISCAERAGMQVLASVEEPVAAALALRTFEKVSRDLKLAVFDMGGYSTSVSIVSMQKDELEQVDTRTTRSCSGRNIDRVLSSWIVEKFKKEQKIDLSMDPLAMERVEAAAVEAKIELSTKTAIDIQLPFITATQSGAKHLMQTLRRSQLDRIVESELDPALDLLHRLLDQHRSIDAVMCIGGSSNCSTVRKSVEKATGLPCIRLNDMSGEFAVVLGAAEYGKMV